MSEEGQREKQNTIWSLKDGELRGIAWGDGMFRRGQDARDTVRLGRRARRAGGGRACGWRFAVSSSGQASGSSAGSGKGGAGSGGRSWPEITVRAVVLGAVLSVVLAAANAYLGLFAGMTVSASIPAAVVSMGVLRLMGRGNILENNIVQTAASAGESLAAGVIFTLPALVIMGFWEEFSYVWVTIIAGLGGLLGVLFTIPLRRALIVEGELAFPEGVATAEVLRSGHGEQADQEGLEEGQADEGQGERGGLGTIAWAGAAGGLFKLGESGLGLWPATVEAASKVGGTVAYFGANVSPALLSVGYIVGLNIAVLILLGGLANWLVAIPICAASQGWPMVDGQAMGALGWAQELWSSQTRYIGVGAMVVGGLWAVVNMRGALVRGVRSGLAVYRRAGSELAAVARTEKDMPMKWVLVGIVLAVVPLFVVYVAFMDRVAVAAVMAGAMLVTGFVFSAVAAYMAGLVGSSNNPISGVTIATVLVSSLLLLVLLGGAASGEGPAAAIVVGSVVCCAAAIAGDNMQDLKAGRVVGATPWKQQVMQMVGTVSAALVMAPVLGLLLKAYGFAGHASGGEQALTAVQANLMASVAQGVFGDGLPWGFVGMGMVLAVGVIVLDLYLAGRGSGFRTPVLAVAIGFYLPLQLAVPIFAGGVVRLAVERRLGRSGLRGKAAERRGRGGVLFASGLITGEALMGIGLAGVIVVMRRPEVLAVGALPLAPLVGVALAGAIGYWLYRAPR